MVQDEGSQLVALVAARAPVEALVRRLGAMTAWSDAETAATLARFGVASPGMDGSQRRAVFRKAFRDAGPWFRPYETALSARSVDRPVPAGRNGTGPYFGADPAPVRAAGAQREPAGLARPGPAADALRRRLQAKGR